jgi:isoleucyl-tRNA synthetase
MSELTNPLDRWVVSRVHQLGTEIAQRMDGYDVASALKPVLPFLDDASNWYVRRSRRRFWKSADDQDKNDAYRTLHYVLVYLSYILAPFTPFLAEELYRKLTGGESVHLQLWPTAEDADELLVRDMAELRDLIAQGLSQRASAGIKVRQPLQSAVLTPQHDFLSENLDFYREIAREELNVKEIELRPAGTASDAGIVVDTEHISPELRREGLIRELIRNVQSARKRAGLQVDDRIALNLSTEDVELSKAIGEHQALVESETLAHLSQDLPQNGYSETVKVEGRELQLSLGKL